MAFTYSPKFETWWKQYPRKSGKEAAYKKWVELGGDELCIMFHYCLGRQAVEWRSEHRPRDKIPQAKTWLNSGAWKDYVKEDGTPDATTNPERKNDGYFFGGEWRLSSDAEQEPKQS